MAEPLPAEHRLGRYEILRTLRRDSDGVDYEARVVDENRTVLIREYLPENRTDRPTADDAKMRSRGGPPPLDAGTAAFLGRYRAIQRVRHAAVARVEECLYVGGTACAVLEHVPGDTLSTRLDEERTLPPDADIFYPLIEGLGAMHAADILHGAIEPACIVVRDDGSPVLGSFGPAPSSRAGSRQAFGADQSEFRQPVAAGYAPLEQYSHRGHLGPWTDIYALGAVMYRCVTGVVPEDAPARALADDIRPAVESGKGTHDRSLLVGIDKALRLRVADRPQSIAAWRTVLAPTADAPARPHARGARGGARASGAPPAAGGPARPRAATPRGRRWWAPALAVLTLAVLTWVDTRLLRTDEGESVTQVVGAETLPVEPQPSRPSPVPAPGGRVASDEAVADTTPVATPDDDEPDDERARPTPDASLPEVRTVDLAVTAVEDPTDATALPERAEPSPEPPAAGVATEVAGTEPRSPPEVVPVEQAPAPAVAAEEPRVAAPSVASLTLELTPPDATVEFLDAPATTYRRGMELPRGTHRIRIARPGHVAESRTLTLGADTRLAVTLVPEPYPFAVSTVPEGAAVRFTDQETAYAPGMLLPPGRYALAVSLPGYETWEGTVLHGEGPTARELRLALDPAGFTDPLASGGAGPSMVIVLPGRFRMGCVSGRRCFNNELPLLDIEIATRFALSKHEITFAEYDRFADTAGAARPEPGDGTARGTFPAVNVSWADATAYAAWLSAATGRPYRLPTEAEWEYAARSGRTTAYSWGPEPGEDRANCADCGPAGAALPVGRFAPNAWGLHDMHGNVWEWTLDCPTGWRPAIRPRADLPGDPDQCSQRVRRGGSFAHSARRMRAASRDITNPQLRSANTGFRVLLELR